MLWFTTSPVCLLSHLNDLCFLFKVNAGKISNTDNIQQEGRRKPKWVLDIFNARACESVFISLVNPAMQIGFCLGSKTSQSEPKENWAVTLKNILLHSLERESQFQLKDFALTVLFAWNAFPQIFCLIIQVSTQMLAPSRNVTTTLTSPCICLCFIFSITFLASRSYLKYRFTWLLVYYQSPSPHQNVNSMRTGTFIYFVHQCFPSALKSASQRGGTK